MNYTPWIVRAGAGAGAGTVPGLVAVALSAAVTLIDTPGAPRLVAIVTLLLSMVLFGDNRWYPDRRTAQSRGRTVFGA